MNITNVYQDSRFNQDIDAKTGYRTKSLLCMAIQGKDGDALGVAQVRGFNLIRSALPFSLYNSSIYGGESFIK